MKFIIAGRTYIYCDALIDQNIYIGEDPIGHCCINKATKKLNGFDVCEWCYNHQDRITLPNKRKNND